MTRRARKGGKPDWLDELRELGDTITAVEAADRFEVAVPTIRRWAHKENIQLMTQAERGLTVSNRKATCALSPIFLNNEITDKE